MYPPQPPAKFHNVYNQSTIRVPLREDLIKSLRLAGIPTEIYYPLCLYLQPAFRYLG
jgi:dTDP-4-amino-4,6-dideoxygalactose transaminase